MKKVHLLTLLFLTITMTLAAQSSLVGDWWFWPDYQLGQRAANTIGPRIEAPYTPITTLKSKVYPFIFFGQDPTDRLEDFVPAEEAPYQRYTIEMWLLYHVNQEVGAFVAFRNKYEEKDPVWLLGLHGKEIVYSQSQSESDFSAAINHQNGERGWKNYWAHLVATYDGTMMRLYLNGELLKETRASQPAISSPKDYQIELASYLTNEPYMQSGDLVKRLRLYQEALSEKEIEEEFKRLQEQVTEGKLYPDFFHYTAGPYLQQVTDNQIGMVWETSEPSNAVISYGTSLPLTEEVTIHNLSFNKESRRQEGEAIQKYVLKDLKADQPYFYQIKSTNAAGESIETGVLTFKTVADKPSSFHFAIIGDTEARPHVNNRVAKLIWDERPDFLLNLGDLTDGGKQDHKFQWNQEYFLGMNQLISRVPVFAVAGNGEGDLFWYNKYHILPYEGKAYYKFSYGDADFFMLDSNRKKEFAKGGEQYEWLETALQESTAKWKFVAHHHAPYTADDDDHGNTWKGATTWGDEELRQIVPLYEKYEVDMVMYGHIHAYQRTHSLVANKLSQKTGVVYVQAGGAGGNLEDFAPTRAWFSAKTFRGHHYLTIDVIGDILELRMYDSEGRMKDIFTIDKSKEPN